MSGDNMLERSVREWLEGEGGRAAPPRLVESVVDATATRKPRPAWAVSLRGQAYGAAFGSTAERPGARPVLALLLALAVMIALVAGILAAGGGPLRRADVPTPPPSGPAIVAQESPSVQPSGPSATGPTPSTSALPGPTAKIGHTGSLAYLQGPADPSSGDPGTLFVGDRDGAHPRPVATQVDELWGWSLSGRYLAFTRPNSSAGGTETVNVITPDGKSIGSIDGGELGEVQWSPTQDVLLVYSVFRDASPLPHPLVALYTADGLLLKRVPLPPDVSTLTQGIDWSPDGYSLAVAGCIGCHGDKYDDTPAQSWGLWVVPIDGRPLTQLTDPSNGIVSGPRWSRDGNWISYSATCLSSDAGGCQFAAFRVHPDGSGRERIPDAQQSGLLSPDGTHVLFDQPPPGSPTGSDVVYTDVYASDPDGSHLVRLTMSGAQAVPLSWSPDGRQILYLVVPVDPADPTALLPTATWMMNADGTNQRKLGTQWLNAAWASSP